MNAIIKQGGHQYNVSEGDVIRVDHVSQPEGAEIVLDNVIMAFDGDDSIVDKKRCHQLKSKQQSKNMVDIQR